LRFNAKIFLMKKIYLILLLFPFNIKAQNNTCDVSEQCIYTVALESANGSGWNGNTMTFYQNNMIIKTIGQNFTTGSSASDMVFFCNDTPFQMIWNEGGNDPENIKVSLISSFNQTIYQKNYGEGNPNSMLFSGISNCSTDCCFFWPTNLNFISSTETSAQISWVTTYNPPQYDVFVTTDLSATSQSNSPFVTVSSNPAEISGLLPCTEYKFFVRYRCSELEQSFWSTESMLFSTQCALEINDNSLQNLLLFPNPTHDYISISNDSTILKIEVWTILGQKMLEKQVNFTNMTIDLSSFESGLYWLKIYDETRMKSVKIIKK